MKTIWNVAIIAVLLFTLLYTTLYYSPNTNNNTTPVTHKYTISKVYNRSTLPTEKVKGYKQSYGYDEYGCTEDCSGHDAGYEWAEDKGICNPDDCDGNSDSFIEGCISYAEEYQYDYQNDYDYTY